MNDVDIDVTVYQFGDAEPEDSWASEDAIVDQVRNLLIRVELLDALGERIAAANPALVIDRIIERAEAALRRRIDARAQHRANQILEDCDIVLARIRRGE